MAALNGLQKLFKSFLVFFNSYLLKPLTAIATFFWRHIILNIYRLLLTVAKFLRPIIEPVQTKYLVPFLNRYVIHFIVIILTGIIVFLNYQVQETRAENFGANSILYSLVRGSDEAPIEDSDTAALGEAPSPEEEAGIAITEGGAVITRGISSIEAAKKSRDKTVQYTIKQGDSLSGIAANFGLRVNTILWANGLTGRSILQAGQILSIPPDDGIVYTVQKGDTLGKIASRYDSEVGKIIEFNKLRDASDISIGDSLFLPDAQPYVPPAPIVKTRVAPVQKLFSTQQPAVQKEAATEAATSGEQLVWPTTTRRLSQYFSWHHTGLDIDGEFGDLVWAAGDGVVSRVQYLETGYGHNVIIDHGNGIQTLYAHFQKTFVTVGQHVKKGEVIGEMGSTGHSTGSHTHFEVRVRGARVNPLSYVRR